MEQYDKGIINVNKPYRKRIVVKPEIYRKFIPSFTLPSILIALVFIASASTYPVHATGGNNETGATVGPSGTSVGTAGSGTNVTQSDCLPQNATTRGSSVVDTGGGRATTTNDTTITFAPSGASIAANDTSTSNATAGNTVTTNDTTITFAPSGASVC